MHCTSVDLLHISFISPYAPNPTTQQFGKYKFPIKLSNPKYMHLTLQHSNSTNTKISNPKYTNHLQHSNSTKKQMFMDIMTMTMIKNYFFYGNPDLTCTIFVLWHLLFPNVPLTQQILSIAPINQQSMGMFQS